MRNAANFSYQIEQAARVLSKPDVRSYREKLKQFASCQCLRTPRYSAKSGAKNLSAALGAFSAELIIPKCRKKRKLGCGITWPPP